MNRPTARDNADHVVILVHGMGTALKGGSLQEWAQPLLLSLNDIALDHREKLPEESPFRQLPPLIIDSADAVSGTPTTWVRVLRSHPRHAKDYATVVITEASWGDDFRPATVRATYTWVWRSAFAAIRRVARLVSWNLMPRIWVEHLSPRTAWIRPLLAVLFIIVAMPLIAAGLLVLGILVALTPIPAVGRLAGSTISLFADFFGDPQTWQRKPLQAAAMRERLIHTIYAYSKNRTGSRTGAPITVVAHSQGAAISAQVLLQGGLRASNFICVGTALPLLGYARWGDLIRRRDHLGELASRGLASPVLPVPADDPISDWRDHAAKLKWINIWAKFDFFPAGPLGVRAGPDNSAAFKKMYTGMGPCYPGPEEHPIDNSAALIKDHIVYSRNRIEVIDPMAQLIYRDCAGPPVPVAEELWLPPLSVPGAVIDPRLAVHRSLVNSLGMTRLLAFLAGALVSWQVLQWLHAWRLPGIVARCSGIAPENSFVIWPCTDAPRWSEPNDRWILLLVAVVVGAILLQVLNGWIWGALHRRVERRRTVDGVVLHAPGQGYVVLYLAAVLVLTVAAPLGVAALSLGGEPKLSHFIWGTAYVGLFLLLITLSRRGHPLSPMKARLP